MPIFSDDDSGEESVTASTKVIKPRKSKNLSFKKFFNNDDDSEYEEPQHDSDNDPDFNYSKGESESSDNETSGNKNDFWDDNFSMISNASELNKTINILKSLPGESFNMSDNDCANSDNESQSKPLSKRKISEECSIILGKARANLWVKKFDIAMKLCHDVISKYPSYPESYDILASIYDDTGDMEKAIKLRYTAAMCDPKNIERWLKVIIDTKTLEGIDKAISITKLVVSRTLSHRVRDVLVELLQEGGYEKNALIKKLVNLHAAKVATDKSVVEKEVEELFYMSEKFESMNDIARSSECMEVLNKKYPSYLTDRKLLEMLKTLIKLKRFNKVLGVSKNIQGVTINIHDLTDSSDLIVIGDEVDKEHRIDIIYALLMAILHLKMPAAVHHRSFREFLELLESYQTYYVTILGKLFNFGFYELVIKYSKKVLDKYDEKLLLMKLIGKSQEKLNLNEEALKTYDYIIAEINGKDPSIWELKANLLYSLKREQDAINVLAESQHFVHDHVDEHHFGKLIRKPKPTKESAQLLYKLCDLLEKEKRTDDFIKVAWKYLFIDSYEYFKINKIKLFCEDMVYAKANFHEITNSLWICFNRSTEVRTGEKSDHFVSSHARMPYESEAWNTLDILLTILMRYAKENMAYIEILSQWGLFLHKILNWNPKRRDKLSSIYISTAIMNRINDIALRTQFSSHMIDAELRIWKFKFGDNVQYWNLYNLYSHLVGSCNNRFVLRSIQQNGSSSYYPDLINAGSVVSNNTKLSITVNAKVHFEHPHNAQVCLHLAITFLNAAISRTCQDPYKTSLLAINFMTLYREARGHCQETWYNLGRFYHRINFYQYAISCYEKCLATDPVGVSPRHRSLTDLTRDAAFNLVLIHKDHHNRPMCEYITSKYLTI